MGLYDAVAEAAAAMPTRGPDCDVGRAIADRPDEAADIHRLIYERRDISAAVLAKLFRASGVHIGRDTIGRHRAGDCTKCIRAGRVAG